MIIYSFDFIIAEVTRSSFDNIIASSQNVHQPKNSKDTPLSTRQPDQIQQEVNYVIITC